MPFLVKTEPSVYSIDDLARDKETVWDGVTNPTAVKYLREMQQGEMFVVYHTGEERTAVGLAKVLSVDPSNPKVPVVRIKFVKRLHTPHTLTEIKAHKLFAGSPLVNQGMLSVVPLTEAQYAWLTGESSTI
jgi:predicted RNA-binding protein with PUA-like domain